MRTARSTLAVCAVGVLATAELAAQSIVLDDFEASAITVVNPAETDPQTRLLWNQYEGDFTAGPDPAVESISSAFAKAGTRSLKVTVTGGNLYLQFYPIKNNCCWGNAREFAKGTWQYDTFNRLRFWIRMPSQVRQASAGQYNLSLGTFIRRRNGDAASAEDGGGHYYHHFNLGYAEGEWQQVIVDTHPNAIRGGNGNTELGDRAYVTGESGYNYFDGLTRFYLDLQGSMSGSPPADFYVDGFEFYRESRPENIAQIYGLTGVYIRSSNTVRVGWQRNKNENDVRHEVRYAFQDIFQLGWAAATPAPGGTVAPPGYQGYNGMDWSTTQINVSGRSTLYIAIKPQNSSSFRQIAIPVDGAVASTSPNAPSDLRVQ
jgi:hypothetical protein